MSYTSNVANEAVDFDEALKIVGGFGKQQKMALASITFLQIFMAFSNFGFVFFGAIPQELYCDAPKSINDTEIVAEYISFAIEWNLTCNGTLLLRSAQIAHMAGLFVGALFFGPLADKFGRLRILYVNFVLLIMLSFIIVIVPNIYVFSFVTFFQGMCCQGCGLTSYTVILESVGPKHRAICGIVEQIFYAIGIALLALLAYILPYWRHLALVLAAFGIPSLLMMLPFNIESTRWLFSVSRHDRAWRNLAYMASTNGRLNLLINSSINANGLTTSSPDRLAKLSCSLPEVSGIIDSPGDSYVPQNTCVPSVKDQTSLVDSFHASSSTQLKPKPDHDSWKSYLTHRLLLKWTAIFSFSWFTNASVYYGTTIAAGEVSSNRFVSFALSGLIEIPGHCFSPWLMNRYGRRKFYSYPMIMSGCLFILISILVRYSRTGVLVLITFAKLFIALSFASAYVYASELFPTSILNRALGLCVTSGRIGGTVAPAILASGNIISSLIFGTLSTISGVIALKIPESLDRKISASISELSETEDLN